MNRSEHLQWCKDRALEYLERGELTLAWASFVSDMSKHPDTAFHIGLGLGHRLFWDGLPESGDILRKHINDYN